MHSYDSLSAKYPSILTPMKSAELQTAMSYICNDCLVCGWDQISEGG